MQNTQVRISELLAPPFRAVWRDMKEFRHRHYWLAGGRGSTKSSAASLRIICGILQDPEANAAIFRRYQVDIKDSVFSQLLWAAEVLGVADFFEARQSPARLIYKPTGQMIIFRGMDDPRKSKSIKMRRGYVKYTWFEEFDQFRGMPEIDTVLRSTMRGGRVFQNIVTYNPPESSASWVNAEAARAVPNRIVHKSTYLDVPREWLGEAFFEEAEIMQALQPLLYKHVYLGEITGTGAEVFTNLVSARITDAQIAEFREKRHGLDFGFMHDPTALVSCAYDRKRRELFVFAEWVAQHKFTDAIFREGIQGRKVVDRAAIVADCSEPREIAELNRLGAFVVPCRKGKDSVEAGIRWLRRCVRIIIDPERAPHAWREFSQYEYRRLRDGALVNEYPDKDNHCIDATRYACEDFIREEQSPHGGIL